MLGEVTDLNIRMDNIYNSIANFNKTKVLYRL